MDRVNKRRTEAGVLRYHIVNEHAERKLAAWIRKMGGTLVITGPDIQALMASFAMDEIKLAIELRTQAEFGRNAGKATEPAPEEMVGKAPTLAAEQVIKDLFKSPDGCKDPGCPVCHPERLSEVIHALFEEILGKAEPKGPSTTEEVPASEWATRRAKALGDRMNTIPQHLRSNAVWQNSVAKEFDAIRNEELKRKADVPPPGSGPVEGKVP